MGVGARLACGACRWKRRMLSLDRASAPVFRCPAIWTALTDTWKWATTKNSPRSSCMSWGSLQQPTLTTSTTAWLSQWTRTDCWLQLFPQIVHAITMVSNSFTAIDRCSHPTGQGYWNHKGPHQAPQPNEPDASDYRWWSVSRSAGSASMDTPFHSSKKTCHHMRSERKDAFKRINCRLFGVPFNSSNIHRRNVLPGRTTLHVCCSFPTRDCSSVFVQNFLPSHSATKALRSLSLPLGSRRIIACVSSSIPRKVRVTAGPSNFSMAIGIRSLSKMFSSLRRSSSHWSELGAATIRKSSR